MHVWLEGYAMEWEIVVAIKWFMAAAGSSNVASAENFGRGHA